MLIKDIAIYIGDTYRLKMTVLDPPAPAAARLVGPTQHLDVTDRTFSAQIRATPDDPDVIVEFDIDMTDAASGVVVLSLPATVTAGLSPGSAVWDVQEVIFDEVTTYARGSVTITRDVTRPTG